MKIGDRVKVNICDHARSPFNGMVGTIIDFPEQRRTAVQTDKEIKYIVEFDDFPEHWSRHRTSKNKIWGCADVETLDKNKLFKEKLQEYESR